MTENSAGAYPVGPESQPTHTVDEIRDALRRALQARDMPAAAALIQMLAVRDPEGVELILAVLNAR